VRKAQREYDAQVGVVKKLETEINNAVADLNKMGREFDGNNDKIKKATGSFEDLSEKINGKVNSAFRGLATGLLAVTGGLSVLAKGSLEGASNLEGYRNTLNVVMGDTKKAAESFAWAVDFANKTPFETDSVVEATVKLQSYGMTAMEVLPAIGDMAGVMGKDLNSAVEAVADAQTGELERLKEFGITKQMIIDKGNEIMRGKELVNSKGQIVDQENFNKALFALMDERFKGGMELQANSFKGLWSTVTGVFQTSFAQMMGISSTGEVVIGGIFDTIKEKVRLVADTLTRWSTDGTLEK
jgi:phage tail tape-measure protein